MSAPVCLHQQHFAQTIPISSVITQSKISRSVLTWYCSVRLHRTFCKCLRLISRFSKLHPLSPSNHVDSTHNHVDAAQNRLNSAPFHFTFAVYYLSLTTRRVLYQRCSHTEGSSLSSGFYDCDELPHTDLYQRQPEECQSCYYKF